MKKYGLLAVLLLVAVAGCAPRVTEEGPPPGTAPPPMTSAPAQAKPQKPAIPPSPYTTAEEVLNAFLKPFKAVDVDYIYKVPCLREASDLDRPTKLVLAKQKLAEDPKLAQWVGHIEVRKIYEAKKDPTEYLGEALKRFPYEVWSIRGRWLWGPQYVEKDFWFFLAPVYEKDLGRWVVCPAVDSRTEDKLGLNDPSVPIGAHFFVYYFTSKLLEGRQ